MIQMTDDPNPFPQMVSVAAQIVTSGRWDSSNSAVERLAKSYAGREDVWYLQTLSGLNFLIITEYRLLKEANEDQRPYTVSRIAWHARNLLELVVWAIYCVGGIPNVRRIYEDAGRDVTDMYSAFKKWGEITAQDTDFISRFATEQQVLAEQAAAEGIDELDTAYTQVSAVAKEIGMADHFRVVFKLLSKWAHPTAMQMVSVADEQQLRLQRECFFSMGCLHFTGAFTAVERLLIPLAKAFT
jgi:hypothetical protein